jgi:hypothetical protein
LAVAYNGTNVSPIRVAAVPNTLSEKYEIVAGEFNKPFVKPENFPFSSSLLKVFVAINIGKTVSGTPTPIKALPKFVYVDCSFRVQLYLPIIYILLKKYRKTTFIKG